MISTSGHHDEEFKERVAKLIDNNALEKILKWIVGEMGPRDLFDDNEIISAANDIGISGCFSDKEIESHVKDNYNPADIFDENELAQWADNNGWTKPDESGRQ